MTQALAPVAAFDILEDGSARPAPDSAPAPGAGARWRWLHLDLADPGLPDWAARHLDKPVAAGLTLAEARPRADLLGEGILLTLRGVNLNPGQSTEDMISLRLWVTGDLIVSARKRKVFAIDALRQKAGEEGRLPARPGAFLADLIEGLTDRIETVSLETGQATEALEEAVFDAGQAPERDALALMRVKIIRLSRYVEPQREALARLAGLDSPLIDPETRARISQSANSTARSDEELDALRERLSTLQDYLEGLHAAKASRNSNILSIVAAIFLPLGFLTGVFGMNVAGLPGVSWPGAFMVVALSMLALAAGLLILFRWLKWF